MSEPDPDNEASFNVCVIPCDRRETSKPKEAIMRELSACKFSEDEIFAVKLALEEALANAIKHGCCNDRSRKITIRYAVSPAKAVIIVRDEGCGFSPSAIPDPTTPEHLPKPDGRGILLIKAYTDEVTFRDQGREVRFVKYHR